MRSLTIEDYNEIITFYPDFKTAKIFVETGTFKGETVKNMSNIFNAIYTVEYSKQLYLELMKNNLPKNINLYNDNSEKFLSDILQKLEKNESIIFFLDAHWAGIDTGFYNEDCPLLKELKIIKKNCKNALIIMDDFNKFGVVRRKEHYTDKRHVEKFGKNGKIEDWKDITLENVLKILNCEEYKIVKERLIIKI